MKTNIETFAEQIGEVYRAAQIEATNHALNMVHIKLAGRGSITIDEFESFVKDWFPNAQLK